MSQTSLPVADGHAVRRHAREIARRNPRLLGGAVALHVVQQVRGRDGPRRRALRAGLKRVDRLNRIDQLKRVDPTGVSAPQRLQREDPLRIAGQEGLARVAVEV